MKRVAISLSFTEVAEVKSARLTLRERVKHFLKKKGTITEAVVKAIAINSLAKFVEYLKYLCIGIFLGFSKDTDAYFMTASFLAIFMVFVVDVFDSVGIPNLVKAKQRSEEEFQNLSTDLLALTLIPTTVVTATSILAGENSNLMAIRSKNDSFERSGYIMASVQKNHTII